MNIFIRTLSTAVIALSATSTFAAESSAVIGKSACGKLANTTQPFILVLESGDDLLAGITQCAKDAKLKSASISALGQVHNPTLAYFTSDPKDKPTLTAFPGYFELASLNGNVTNNAGKYYTHAHAVLADAKFQGIAGHVNSAQVGLTVEVTIVPFANPIERAVDGDTGFGPIVE